MVHEIRNIAYLLMSVSELDLTIYMEMQRTVLA